MIDSADEAHETIVDRGIDPEVVDEYLATAGDCTEPLLDEYDIEGEVDEREVRRWLVIGFAELAVDYIDNGVWTTEDDFHRIIADIDHNPTGNATLVAGVVNRRSDAVRHVTDAIIRSRFDDGSGN